MENIEEFMNDLLHLAKNLLTQLDLKSPLDREQLDKAVTSYCIERGVDPEIGSELIYEAFNSIAREKNMEGDIQGSLDFLILAMEHIKEWEMRVEKYQGDMQVTILSELYINICNAQLYLEKFSDV